MKLYGKDNALGKLRTFAESGRFPHALLFLGEEGIGKKIMADYTAMMYVCQNKGGAAVTARPCMECSGCRRAEQHTHPDVVYPMPDIWKIPGGGRINALREFIASCYRKPTDSEVRVIVFDGLDNFSALMQNALLKEIEEPVPHNRFIFTAAKSSAVLTTVLSRVVPVELSPANEADFTRAMRDNGAGDRAAELFTFFGGNIGKALSYIADEKQAAMFEKAAAICDALCDSREYECLAQFCSITDREGLFAVLGLLTDIFAAAAAESTGISGRGKRVFAAQKEKAAAVFGKNTVYRLYRETYRLCTYSTANPNVALFAAECCSVLFSAAYDNK